jgi:hypothetical protein
VDPAQLISVVPLISSERFQPYLDKCNNDAAQALRLYTWNIEISAALLGPIHVLEVAMRNAMHHQMSMHFGCESWWTHPDAQLTRALSTQIESLAGKSVRSARRNGREAGAGDLVAILGLSFWIGLLGKGGLLQFETRYWQPILRQAFPNYSGSRADIFKDFDFVRMLRNRLAHHESVFGRHLQADYLTIHRLTHYIDDDAARFLDSQSRVAEVLAKRERVVQFGYTSSF